MDIPRPNAARERRRRRILYAVTSLLVITLVTVGLSRLKPAAPTVERSFVVMDTVKRGELLRQVHGNGTLIPEEIRWIPATTQGRIERILVLPGTAVKADTVLLEMSNPELEQAAFDAEWQLKAAEAQLPRLKVQLESERLTQEAAAASLKSDYAQAELEAEADETLAKDGLVAGLTAKRSRSKSDELKLRYGIEVKRLKISEDSTRAQLDVQKAELEKNRAQLELKRQQVGALKVRAGIDGVLQRLGDVAQLQAGQQVGPGANLARVANPARLKAEIKIVETQAKDVTFNQIAVVDTRNGVIPGHVVRKDPSANQGTITVDIALDGPLPKGAVPDLSVDGTIEIDRLSDVLYVGRPVSGNAEGQTGLFKVVDGGKGAVRVTVKLGRSSVSTIEIVEGLRVGDQVILSDMSAYDAHERVKIN